MIDSLLDKKLSKKFDTLAEKKASVQKEEDRLCKQFLAQTTRETIVAVLNIVQEFGHPNEQALSQKLKNKYENETLSFDDILTLNELYKANYRNMSNKED